VLLSSDEKLRDLNRNFRGKNKPTNVLSFPVAANRHGYRGDIAIGGLEGCGHAVGQARRRIIGNEIHGNFSRDEFCAGVLMHQQVYGLLDLGKAVALNGRAEEHFGTKIMAVGIEFKAALAAVQRLPLGPNMWAVAAAENAGAGEDARQFLHVPLRVTAVDAERMQLHQFAGVVFVDMLDRVLCVVQILQHGRVLKRRHHQVAEFPERVRTDDVTIGGTAGWRVRRERIVEA